MSNSVMEIEDIAGLDKSKFQTEIVAQNVPVLLKSLVSDWPAVQRANMSSMELCRYLSQFDQGKENMVLVGPDNIDGRFFYNDELTGFNYTRLSRTLTTTFDALLAMASADKPEALALQGVSIDENLPGFGDENSLHLLDNDVRPRFWLGNKTVTNTHYDTQQNIACAVSGRRKITFFPPQQISNLYIGPLLLTPAGTPMSMVDLRKPDLVRYPKFQAALDTAIVAYLEPGDAVYIPSYWWHNVESLDSFSLLINYWWGGFGEDAVTPYNSLLHSLMSIPSLPVEQRKIWREFFDYYVFRLEQDPTSHLPDELDDIIGKLSPQRKKRIKDLLAKKLLG